MANDGHDIAALRGADLARYSRRVDEAAQAVPAGELPSATEYLRDFFGDWPELADQLDTSIAALVSDTGMCAFTIAADPTEDGQPGRYEAIWRDRSRPPILIKWTHKWREGQAQ